MFEQSMLHDQTYDIRRKKEIVTTGAHGVETDINEFDMITYMECSSAQ